MIQYGGSWKDSLRYENAFLSVVYMLGNSTVLVAHSKPLKKGGKRKAERRGRSDLVYWFWL